MKPDEAQKLVREVATLFPLQVTQAQGKWLAEQFSPLSQPACAAAIKEHRATRQKWDLSQLIEGCKAAEHADDVSRDNARREGTLVDVYRRQRLDLAKAGDVEVILRVHRGWWYAARQSVYRQRIAEFEDATIEQYLEKNSDRFKRRRFFSSAVGCLISCFGAEAAKLGRKLTAQEDREMSDRAERLAATIFADPHDFDLCLQDLRGELVGAL